MFARPAWMNVSLIVCGFLIGCSFLPLAAPAALAASQPVCLQPPTTVDHATLDAGQLAQYGLPQRMPGETLAHWQRVVRSAKTRVCQGKATRIAHQIAPGGLLPATSDEMLSNWAGNIAINYGYTSVVGQWNVPCLTLLLHTGFSNAWVGLGGDGKDGGGNLVQAGSESDEYTDFPGHWTANYFAWIEDFPNDSTEVEAFGVNCSDTMYANVWQDYSGGMPVKTHMYISDWSSGNYWSAYNTQAFSNGSTAEWIVERPIVNKVVSSLADFNYVDFTQCYAIRNGSAVGAQNLPHNYSTMRGVSNNMLANPGPLYPDSGDIGYHFTTYWDASH